MFENTKQQQKENKDTRPNKDTLSNKIHACGKFCPREMSPLYVEKCYRDIIFPQDKHNIC